jgi:hypothetical protein
MVEQKYTPPRSRIVSGVPLGIETIPPVPGGLQVTRYIPASRACLPRESQPQTYLTTIAAHSLSWWRYRHPFVT